MSEIVEYLRERALMCVRLARACRDLDLATSHALEGLAADLMAKAKELEVAHWCRPVEGEPF